MPDILSDLPHLFLGSRLKRLAERLQAEAARVIRNAGFAIQPAQMPLLAAIHRYGAMTVGDAVAALGVAQPTVTRSIAGLVELGLVETSRADRGDQRTRTIALTVAGTDAVERCMTTVWAPVDLAVRELCGGLSGGVADQLGALEVRLDAASIEARVASQSASADPARGLRVLEFTDALAADFHRINEQWISATFTMEANDYRILENPRALIVDRGGTIGFVEAPGLGVVGTCALLRIDDGVFELTKMGVLACARGRKAGEFLLRHMIARAAEMAVTTLYLLTNRKAAAAIHLYEKVGFVHDAAIMRDYGSRYARCDVAMRYSFD